MAMTPAMESIFANAQQNAASLIETATLAINAKVNTIEEAEAMIQELSSEAVKFNELLTCIMNAMRQVESGDMQKEEAAGIIAPAVKELKDKCTALKIANVEAPGDDITEDEIATLRELIIGAKAAAEDRLVAIRLCDDCKVDPEVENELNPPEENGEAFEFDPATEGISSFIQKMHAKKVNKAKVTVLMDSLKDKKTDAIVKKVIDAMKPALVAGADGLSAIKRDVDEMQKADGGDASKYEGKISSFDYVVKTISGVGVGYIPENPSEGTGLAQIMVPTKDRKGNVVGTVITVRTACEYILNPIKESEVTEAMEAYEEIAEEVAFLAHQYVNTTECKTAKALYQNAKKLYSMGSKEKALEYMKKAKDLYDKCLKKLLNESGKFERAERVDPIKKHGGTATIRHNVTRTDSLTFAIARSKLENKIDRCTAHILQWTTKAGKETYQQTLDQLKADREQAKAAKKAAKANKNNNGGSATMENYSEFMYSCESMMDDLMLQLNTYPATEADGTEGEDSPSGIGAKLKSGFAKLKKAVKRGDKKAVDEATSEIKSEAEKLDVPADDPKKDRMSTAAKVGLVAAASVAATIGLANGGLKLKELADSGKFEPNTAGKAIINAAVAISKAADKNAATQAATIGAGAVSGAVLGHYAGKKVGTAAGKAIAKKIQSKKDKEAAKAAADAAAEAFGLEAYDVYETIIESFGTDVADMNDLSSATEAAINFTYVMEEIFDNMDIATEGQTWQAVKALLGSKSREARKAIKEGKKLAKSGDKTGAASKFNEAKSLFGEQKAALQRLPKDMWDTIASWINVGLLPLIYSFIGEGGYKDAPNKNVNVAAVINYLNRAMKKCDELAKSAGNSENNGSDTVEESLNAAMSAMLESLNTDEISAAFAADMK